jgi:endonuclease/exonuclease/phosphatase family metal-dependent hydrolase
MWKNLTTESQIHETEKLMRKTDNSTVVIGDFNMSPCHL